MPNATWSSGANRDLPSGQGITTRTEEAVDDKGMGATG